MREAKDIAKDLRHECTRITAPHPYADLMSCLLYTSDAADEL